MSQELLLKIGIRLGILLVTFTLGSYVEHGRVMAKWDAETVKLQDAQLKAVADRLAENKALKAKYELDYDQWKVPYESAIESLASERDKLKSAGLWLTRKTCSDGSAHTGKTNTSAGANDSTERYRLPEKINNDLRDLAADASTYALQLRDLQQWVIKYCPRS